MKNKLTKLLSIFLIAGLVGAGSAFTLTACGGGGSDNDTNTEQPGTTELKVTFNWNGKGGTTTDVTVDENGKVTLPQTPAVEGWVLVGWYANAECTGNPVDVAAMVHTSSITVYAKWAQTQPAAKIKVTFNWNGKGGTTKEVEADDKGKVTLPATPTVEGWTFGGWYATANCTGNPVDVAATVHTSNKTYYAKWTKNEEPSAKIKVTFNWKGTGGTITEVEAGKDGKVTVPQAQTVEGWTFGGWFDNDACTGTAIDVAKVVHTSNKTYYAKWTKNQSATPDPGEEGIKITFNWNGQVDDDGNASVQIAAVNGHVDPPGSPWVAGYEMTGWYDNEDCTGEAVEPGDINHTASKTYYAKWEPAGGGEEDDMNGTYKAVTYNGENYGLSTDDVLVLSDEGHILHSENGQADVLIQRAGPGLYTMTVGEHSCIIKIEDNQVIYLYADLAASEKDEYSMVFVKGTQIPVPVENKLNNDKFMHSGETPDPTPAIKVTFNWKGHGGETPTEVEADENGKVTAPQVQNVTGWAFDGWYDNDACTGSPVNVASVEHKANKDYYAKWVQLYKVTFNWKGHGGTTTEVETDKDGKVAVPRTPTVEGGTLLGWYDNEECTGEAVNVANVKHTENKTYYANWKMDYVPGQGGFENNAILPAYSGPAEALVASSDTVKKELKPGVNITATPTEADWTDGIITVIKNSAVESKSASKLYNDDGETVKSTTATYSHAIKNGKYALKASASGTLVMHILNGSSTKHSMLAIKNASGTTVASYAFKNTETSRVVEVTFDIEAGNYTIETVANGNEGTGTVRLMYMSYEFALTKTSYTGIVINSMGTTNYLVTQKLDCRDVSIGAVDENGVITAVDLANCEFDTSYYNPDESGEYTIGVTYKIAGNLGSNKTEFTATYKVKVFKVDSIRLETIGLSGSTQLTAKQAYLKNGTLSKENITAIGNCILGEERVEFKLKSDWLDYSTVDMASVGVKTVNVSVNSDYTVDNKEVKASYQIAVAEAISAQDGKVEVSVGEEGDFKTVTQAVQFLAACNLSSDTVKIIKLAPGVYTEKVWLTLDNVILMGTGEKADDTVLTYSLVEGMRDPINSNVWGLNCATLHVKAKNFKAYNLAIRNDFDYIHEASNYSGNQAAQGLALTIEGDSAIIYKCHLYGNQDTFYVKSGRVYCNKSQIDGNIDFIFGGDTSLIYLEECKIVAIDRKKGEETGYVTAVQHKDANKPDYGYIFYNCELTAEEGVQAGSMALGRTWGPKATVAYINCTMSDAYSTLEYGNKTKKINRWMNMGGDPQEADFCEYGNTGDGAISEAVKGGKLLSSEQAANYTKANIFGANNGKLKSTYATAWDCDAALTALKGIVEAESTATVTVKNTDGDTIASVSIEIGDSKTADELKALINAQIVALDMEVDGIYTAYTDAETNTLYTTTTFDADAEVIVTLKDRVVPYYDIDFTVKAQNDSTPVNDVYGDLLNWTGGQRWNGNSIQVYDTTVITMSVKGTVTITWFENKYGSLKDVDIYYVGGYATIKVLNSSNVYIERIHVDCLDVPATDTAAITATLNYNYADTDDDYASMPEAVVQNTHAGNYAVKPTDPSREGYKFLGWFTAATGGTEYDFNTAITESTEIFAHWEKGETVYKTITSSVGTQDGSFIWATNNLPTEHAGLEAKVNASNFKKNEYYKSEGSKGDNGGWFDMPTGSKLTFTVAKGASIYFSSNYSGGVMTVTVKSGDTTPSTFTLQGSGSDNVYTVTKTWAELAGAGDYEELTIEVAYTSGSCFIGNIVVWFPSAS